MTVKKDLPVLHLRQARVSLRIHEDLRRALEFLAHADSRKLAAYIDLVLRDHVAAMLLNSVGPDGRIEPDTTFRLRSAGRQR